MLLQPGDLKFDLRIYGVTEQLEAERERLRKAQEELEAVRRNFEVAQEELGWATRASA